MAVEQDVAPASQSSQVVLLDLHMAAAADTGYEDHGRGADVVDVARVVAGAAHHA